MKAGVGGINDCLEENHLFLHVTKALQEKKPVKTI
jgi:hypothetical protein